jgi:hypothetical protein
MEKMKYTYPVTKIKQLHVWRKESGIYPPSFYSGYYEDTAIIHTIGVTGMLVV